ncbi:MAG: family 4 glycosyl hydrolase [Planctomycetota bacterium]|jgi:alpha-galactosidase
MKAKLVIIGSGSQFTEFFLQELFKYEEFKGCTLALVDRRPERLKHELNIAKTLNDSVDWDVTVKGHTERKEALEGANFVYSFFAVNQLEAWKKEFEIANKYDIYPLEGVGAGPPSIGFSMRHVPVMLDICEDIERICPDAWLIMDNNPLSKLVAAVQRFTKVKHVGYCNGQELVQMAIEQILDMTDRDDSKRHVGHIEREYLVPSDTVELTSAGINHLTWVTDIVSTSTGEDLYPKLFESMEKNPDRIPKGYKYSAELCKIFGLFPSPADGHISDYLWFADKAIQDKWGMKGFPVDEWFGNRDASAWEKIAASINDKKSAQEFISKRRTGWYNVQIARIMLSGKHSYFPAINVVNNGVIPNLPSDIIVEIPGIVGPDDIKAVKVKPLPDHIVPYCTLYGKITNLIADGAATGSKEKMFHALLLDPFVHSMDIAKKLLDDIFDYNRKYDTRFS